MGNTDIKPFAKTLINHGEKVFSQTIEDGIIEEVFNNIGTTNKYFVDIGAWDGCHLSNTANLRINKGWKGLLIDGNQNKTSPIVIHFFVNPENVNQILKDNHAPEVFDLLSIDIDGNDFWIWDAINYKPRVVIIEFNANIVDQHKSCVIKYNQGMNTLIPDANYFGASIAALKKLGEKKGYSLIFRITVLNLIFVRTELLHDEDKNIPLEMFINKDGIGKEVDLSVYLDYLVPHWNEYSDTNMISMYKPDETREWIEI